MTHRITFVTWRVHGAYHRHLPVVKLEATDDSILCSIPFVYRMASSCSSRCEAEASSLNQ